MELVNRLKLFLSTNNIAVTQFADICNIPRPTVSQIINGRNKKISDEIIAKIHNAYPELSIYWLMFGEGEMGNINESHNIPGSNATARESNIFDFPYVTDEILNSHKEINHMADDYTIDKGIQLKERYITKIVVFYNDNSFESFSQSSSNNI